MKGLKKPSVVTYNLERVYSRRNVLPIKALDGVFLEVFPAEFLAIVGLSGSGKTTLLNTIGALDRPTTGEVMFEGVNLSSLSDRELAFLRRDKIGFIFQNFNLLPSLTVFENIEAALVSSRMSRIKVHEKVSATLDSFGLTAMADRLPLELSIGQQQKVAIARAIVKEPMLILADEPTGEMDPIAGVEIMDKLVELNKKFKTTLIFASHSLFIQSYADRTLFIKSGKIVSQKEAGY
jgi:putative ABC transport system ATP-binding protein